MVPSGCSGGIFLISSFGSDTKSWDAGYGLGIHAVDLHANGVHATRVAAQEVEPRPDLEAELVVTITTNPPSSSSPKHTLRTLTEKSASVAFPFRYSHCTRAASQPSPPLHKGGGVSAF